MTGSPRVSVVVLSYNRPRHLERALESVIAQGVNVEVLVVDNRSAASAEIAAIVGRYTDVRLIAHPQNLGFTGGMNSGIAAARGEYIYLTEDDIQLEPGCLSALLNHLDSDRNVGAVGPIMIDRLGGAVRCAGGHFSLGGTYRMTIIRGRSVNRTAPGVPYHVMYLPGASIMTRKSLFATVGSFRHDFFMYVEDVEFCTRVLKQGLFIDVVPEARVLHDEPEPGVPRAIEFHKIKNLASLYFVHARLVVLPAFIIRYGAVGLVRAFASRRLGVHIKAWAWVLAHAPLLLAERSGGFRETSCD